MPDALLNIVEKSLCTGCGTCAGVCPSSAVTMVETPDGRIISEVSAACTECGLCEKCCPQIDAPEAFFGGFTDMYNGEILSAYLAKASDNVLVQEGQSGGPTTALLEYLFNAKMIDCAVAVSFGKDGPLRPVAEIFTSSADIRRSQGSKYCPVSLNTALREIAKKDLRTAVVGLGCHLQGVCKAMENIPAIGRNIVIKIGLFCSGTMTFGAQDYLIRIAGTTPEKLRRFAYRDKGLHGWPGDVCAEDVDGIKHWATHETRWGAKMMFMPPYCRVCLDKMNFLADIVIGDAYGLCNDKLGLAEVLTRTQVGQDAWDAAVTAGYINSTPHDKEDISRRQAGRRYVTNSANYAAAWKAVSGIAPAVWNISPWAKLLPAKAFWDIKRKLRKYLREQTAEGRHRRVMRSPASVKIEIFIQSVLRVLCGKLRAICK